MFDEVEDIEEGVTEPGREEWQGDNEEERHISSISKIKYACYANCYRKVQEELVESASEYQKAWKLRELKKCTSLCKSETKSVKSHLPTIEKEASKQLQKCTNDCIEQAKIFQPSTLDVEQEEDPKAQYGKCLWKCYNSLDRKYQNIWVEKDKDKKS